MRRTFPALLACVALGLSACGGDDTEEPAGGATQVNPAQDSQAEDPANTTQAAAPEGGEPAVGMKDLKFVPDSITAKVGQTVRFSNNESIPHNVVSQDGPQKFESDTFGQDGTYELKLTDAGTISYVCTLHPGMDGTITVEE